MKFDHLAIQIPVGSLNNTILWYTDFFDCKQNWSQYSDFQPLTRQRIPGIKSIVELESRLFCFHLFESSEIHEKVLKNHIQNHHLGFSVKTSNEIDQIIEKWNKLYQSQRYLFVQNAYITNKIRDSVGVESAYFTDVNGLEFEITYVPQPSAERHYALL